MTEETYVAGTGRHDGRDLNTPILMNEVRVAVRRAKLGKATGIDSIPSEVLKNDTAIMLLHKLIGHVFEKGVVPDEWLKGVISPVFKSGSKDVRDPMQYRGIVLLCTMNKIYCHILNARLSKWLDENNVLVDEQNGFRRMRSCIDHIFSLYSILQNRMLLKEDTFCCFIDAKKGI